MNSSPSTLRFSSSRPAWLSGGLGWLARGLAGTASAMPLEVPAVGRVEDVHGAGLGRQGDGIARLVADALVEHRAHLGARDGGEQDGVGARWLDDLDRA